MTEGGTMAMAHESREPFRVTVILRRQRSGEEYPGSYRAWVKRADGARGMDLLGRRSITELDTATKVVTARLRKAYEPCGREVVIEWEVER